MQRINRIIAFASVSFVLIFIAKINKAGLHTAWFKTLAESEIRNSQDLAPQDLRLSQEFSLDSQKGVDQLVSGGSTATHEVRAAKHFVPRQISSRRSVDADQGSKLLLIRAAMPRAPTA